MNHKCQTKKSPIWCMRIDSFGNLYCMSCGHQITDEDVSVQCLVEINQRFKQRRWIA